MNILPVPVAPERDANPSNGRKADRSAFEAFEGEFRRAGDKARGAGSEASARLDEPAETAAPSEREDGRTADETQGREPARDVLGLLTAKVDGKGAEDAGTSAVVPAADDRRATPADGDEGAAPSKGAVPADRRDVADDLFKAAKTIETLDDGAPVARPPAAPNERAPTRLQILRQETHFEPTMREGVLVGPDESPDMALPRERGGDLLQMLAARAPAGAEKAVARSVELPSPRDLARSSPRTLPATVEQRPAARESERFATASNTGVQMVSAAGSAALAASMTSQVAARIVDAFPPAPSLPAEHPAGEAHLRLRAGGAALKTLTIQLQPETLGTVQVSMRLVEGRLALELAASRADTARVLLEDRTALRTLLEKAGFNVDEAAISVVAREAGPQQAQSQAMGQAGGREADGSGGRDSRSFERDAEGGGEGRPREEPDRRPGSRAGAGQEPASRARGGSIFL